MSVRLQVKVKRIVFTSMTNRSESHLLHCINPNNGLSVDSTGFFLCRWVFSVTRSFLRSYHLFFVVVLYCLQYKLCNNFPRWSLWAVFFFIRYYLFDHEHKLIWYSFSWKYACRQNENLIKKIIICFLNCWNHGTFSYFSVAFFLCNRLVRSGSVLWGFWLNSTVRSDSK